MISYTGLGSMPGTDFREACRIVLDLQPGLAAWPELPARGPAAAMVGRTLGLMELGADLGADGWRLARGGSRTQARSARLWRNDLDDLTELAQTHEGTIKVAVCGPWTLAASVRGAHPTMNLALADRGACRDICQALAQATADLLVRVNARLAEPVVLQVDEPAIGAVLGGRIRDFSGLARLRVPEPDEVRDGWRAVVDAARAAGASRIWAHSCGPSVPITRLRAAGFDGFAVDAALLRCADLDELGAVLGAGATVCLGVAPTHTVQVPSADELVETALKWLRPLELDPGSLLDQVVLSPVCGLANWPHSSAVELFDRLARAAELLSEQLDH